MIGLRSRLIEALTHIYVDSQPRDEKNLGDTTYLVIFDKKKQYGKGSVFQHAATFRGDTLPASDGEDDEEQKSAILNTSMSNWPLKGSKGPSSQNNMLKNALKLNLLQNQKPDRDSDEDSDGNSSRNSPRQPGTAREGAVKESDFAHKPAHNEDPFIILLGNDIVGHFYEIVIIYYPEKHHPHNSIVQ